MSANCSSEASDKSAVFCWATASAIKPASSMQTTRNVFFIRPKQQAGFPLKRAWGTWARILRANGTRADSRLIQFGRFTRVGL